MRRKTLAHLPAPAAPAKLRHGTRRPTRTSHMRTHTVRRASRRHLTTTLALLLAASALTATPAQAAAHTALAPGLAV